jgi:Tfp pilus assembly protein PilF
VGPGYGIGISSRQGNLLADEATRKALELDDSLSEVHAARAMALATALRWSEVKPQFRHAVELNPNNATAHYFYAIDFLIPEGRINKALQELQSALSLDPLSSIVNTNYGCPQMEAHRYPEALAQLQKALERDPNSPPAHYKLSQLYATTGRMAEAVHQLQEAARALHEASPAKPILANDGEKSYLEWTMAALEDADQSSAIAVAYALSGNRDKAF